MPQNGNIYWNSCHRSYFAKFRGKYVAGSSASLAHWGDDSRGAVEHAFAQLLAHVPKDAGGAVSAVP